ncbi:MAG: sigma-70 family RNA polymerase sigma factor [Gemmatimonadota bacterium]
MSDHDLAQQAAQGDSDAFSKLIDRHAAAARRLARTVLQNSEDADDAAQDGFLLAWRHIDRYDPNRPFAPWLMRIVMNAAADLRRKRKVRSTEQLPPGAPARGGSPEEETDRTLFRTELTEALKQLPDRQRTAVVLFDAEGYGHADIAAILGIPEGTVRSDVFHARRALRKALTQFREESS